MLRTDSFMDVAFLFTLKAVQYIPAQNIHFVLPGDLVPEVFDLNCRIRLPLRPQNRRTFTTDCNARRLPLRPFTASITRSPATLRHRAASGRSFTMKVENAMVWNGTGYGTYLVEQFSIRQRYSGCSPHHPMRDNSIGDKFLGCQGRR